jgi:hypothetical protein
MYDSYQINLDVDGVPRREARMLTLDGLTLQVVGFAYREIGDYFYKGRKQTTLEHMMFGPVMYPDGPASSLTLHMQREEHPNYFEMTQL